MTLRSKGTSIKTAADGTFNFSGNVGLARQGGQSSTYRIDPGFLIVEARAHQELRIEVVDGAGHHQGGLARSLAEGHHRIALAEAMPVSGANAGLYFLRLRLGGESFTHPFFYNGNGSAGTVFAAPLREAARKQAAAVVDTLVISKTGYQDFVMPIPSYTSGNLGNINLLSMSADGWVNLFNGRDLSNWTPLIHGAKGAGDNLYDTFRADSVDNVIRIEYDKYPNLDFADHCGNLYYNKRLTNYRIRVTYRFYEPQAKNPVGWGRNNSGLMIFAIDPATVTGDPEFPPLIEIQLLGNPSSGGSTNPNYCEPNGIKMKVHTADCGNNHTGIPPNPAGTWTTTEAEVHVNGVTKVFQYPDTSMSYRLPDTAKPVFTMSGPTYNNQPVTGGFLTLQSESQPIEFKNILLKELPE